jgi:hypothetical protein
VGEVSTRSREPLSHPASDELVQTVDVLLGLRDTFGCVAYELVIDSGP